MEQVRERLAEIFRRVAGVSALQAMFLWGTIATAQGPIEAHASLEYQVKAAFLLNFARFVEWPESGVSDESSPMVFCILGPDPFGQTLDEIVAGELVGGRRVEVHRMRNLLSRKCHILFAGASEKTLPNQLANLPPEVLAVGEGKDFIRRGGAIAFVVESRRVRFEVNQSAAARAGLKISSRLLSVARSIGE